MCCVFVCECRAHSFGIRSSVCEYLGCVHAHRTFAFLFFISFSFLPIIGRAEEARGQSRDSHRAAHAR